MVVADYSDLYLRLLNQRAYRAHKMSLASRDAHHVAKQRRKSSKAWRSAVTQTRSRCRPSQMSKQNGTVNHGLGLAEAVPLEGRVRIPKVGTLVPESFWVNPLCEMAGVFKVCNAIQIREAIGQGSFGTVFKINFGTLIDGCLCKSIIMRRHPVRTLRHPAQSNTAVCPFQKEMAALKCVQKSSKPQDQCREVEKVKCEFSVWQAVSEHPNVVSLIGFLQTDKNWCFVMEFASLGSLSRYLKDIVGGPLEIEQSRRLVGQLAHAIFCVHQMGFLHRDISCSNVLLVKAADHPTHLDAKLTDFGLSIRGHASSNRCGSLAYMSPEVLERTVYGIDADWWSFGIVVYCMFVGMTPLSVFARRGNIELSSLSKDIRYELAKTVTIHIGRELNPDQRSLLIDILQDNPWDRLGVWRYSYPDGTKSDTLEPLRRHKFLAGFDWSKLAAVEDRLMAQQQIQDTNGRPSAPNFEIPTDHMFACHTLSPGCPTELGEPNATYMSETSTCALH
ncbi:tyrosine-protein kinase SYK-like [Tropilaelaps mercedesae]|uniref:Tyrosine-protein kinase SYK-like n=1 Tax=Tropilaelaps mercedesae TaxID=418985 RepID=A0A1V9X7Z6_9ACAR|nr:tyrosine-protein kinase SYK-like [Tropilaelaps mercedesae]